MRVVVIGGGALGASTAAELHARGAEVTLVDAVAPGGGTTSRGGGIVAAGGWHPTGIRLVRRSIEILSDLSADMAANNIPFKYHRVGSTTLASPSLVGPLRTLAALQRAHGVDAREVPPQDVPDLPRHAGIDVEGVAMAVHYPEDGWVRPRLFTELRAYGLMLDGARVIRASARLEREGDRIRARTDAKRLEADAIVLAAGVHTRGILNGIGLDAPLVPYRTQATMLRDARASEVPILHDAALGFYMRPDAGGQLLAGDGTTLTPEDPVSWRADADASFVDASLARVRQRFPYLRGATVVSAWAGIDAATPDRLLLAGRYPGVDGLWICAGGNGHGVMRAPAVGESLAAMVMGEKSREDLSAYDPARFRDDMSRAFAPREGYSLHEPEA